MKEIEIELTEDVAQGSYSNLAIIAHSHSEFIIDFVRVLPNVPKAKVQNRIIMTPDNAERLLKALNENLIKFKKQKDRSEPSTAHLEDFMPKGEA